MRVPVGGHAQWNINFVFTRSEADSPLPLTQCTLSGRPGKHGTEDTCITAFIDKVKQLSFPVTRGQISDDYSSIHLHHYHIPTPSNIYPAIAFLPDGIKERRKLSAAQRGESDVCTGSYMRTVRWRSYARRRVQGRTWINSLRRGETHASPILSQLALRLVREKGRSLSRGQA